MGKIVKIDYTKLGSNLIGILKKPEIIIGKQGKIIELEVIYK
jgi:hypothetical protein